MKSKKEIIIVDMDDVMCEGGYLFLLNRFLKSNYTIEDFKDHYYLDDIIEDERQHAEFARYLCINNPYLYSTLVPGAYDGLKLLSEKYEIVPCTAYYFPNVDAYYSGLLLASKLDYIVETFSFINPGNIIFSGLKNNFTKIAYQIDDRIENLRGTAKEKLLFSAYHNGNITKTDAHNQGVLKLNNWKEIIHHILG